MSDSLLSRFHEVEEERDDMMHRIGSTLDLDPGADLTVEVPAKLKELKNILDQVCDVFQIGERARSPSAILTNVENAARFSDYLHAIEREFLMVHGEPDADFPDEEPEDECLVNSWGARSREHYVEQFRRSLARLKAEWQAEALEKAADQLPNSHPVAIGLRNQAAELRRQAEGDE